eukprot:COSAG02_NODE_101_length_36804_cov_125.342951_25_plen_108_part_00
MVFAQDVGREATRQEVQAQLNAAQAQALAEQEREREDDFVPVEFERRIRSANERMAMALGVGLAAKQADLPGGYCPCVHTPGRLGGALPVDARLWPRHARRRIAVAS